MSQMKRRVSCHICNLPIPHWIVDHDHPLSKTTDHIVPKSLGGSNEFGNKAPAHRKCNNLRGVQNLSKVLSIKCRLEIIRLYYLVSSGKVDYFPDEPRWAVVRHVISEIRRVVEK